MEKKADRFAPGALFSIGLRAFLRRSCCEQEDGDTVSDLPGARNVAEIRRERKERRAEGVIGKEGKISRQKEEGHLKKAMRTPLPERRHGVRACVNNGYARRLDDAK